MTHVQGMLGNPMRSADGSDSPPERWQGATQAGGGQIGADRFRTGRHRFKPMCLTSGFEIGKVGGAGPQRRRRSGRGLVSLGFRDGEGRLWRWRLLAFGQASHLAGLGSAGGVCHASTKVRTITRGTDAYRVLLSCNTDRYSSGRPVQDRIEDAWHDLLPLK